MYIPAAHYTFNFVFCRLGLKPYLWQSALGLLEMLKKEEEMFSAINKRQSKDGDKKFLTNRPKRLKLDNVILQLVQSVLNRRMPAMSIEAGLREMEMMNKWQERNARLMEEANSSWRRRRRSR
ncbi:hypothetical protein K1719_016168 [Acacia pycnantha]|nr:hypothetical protein K1719_016168 [Acacia pycnantha]